MARTSPPRSASTPRRRTRTSRRGQGTELPDNDDVQVNTIGNDQVRVQTRSLSVDEVSQVKQAIATRSAVFRWTSRLQPDRRVLGGEITQKALIALGVFLVLVTLVIWAYFRNCKMSVAALIALLHDLVLTVGIYALVGFTVTPATLIGVLTILGYSLYDTVVVFDKVRENVRDIKSSTTDLLARPPTRRSTRCWSARSTPPSSACCRSRRCSSPARSILGEDR